MATRFEDEFPRGGEFDSGYTTAPPSPPAASGLYGVQQEDPVAELVYQLLGNKMDVPEPPKVNTASAIFGALGDAFVNWGNIRAGGQGGQGPFAANMERRRQEYEANKAAYAAREYDVKKLAVQEMMRVNDDERKRRLAQAAKEADRKYNEDWWRRQQEYKATNEEDSPFAPEVRQVEVSEVTARNNPQIAALRKAGVPDGTPILQGIKRNPDGSITPGNIIGSAPVSNQVRDIMGMGYGGINPKTLGVTPVGGGGYYPPPTAAELSQAENMVDIESTIVEMRTLAKELNESDVDFGWAWLQQGVRSWGPQGSALSEKYGYDIVERVATVRDRLGIQIARLVEPNRLSDEDREFALRQLGTPASLAGNDRAALELFNNKLDFVQNAVRLRKEERRRMRPELVGEAREEFMKNQPVFSNTELLGLFTQAGMIGQSGAPGAGPASGQWLPESAFDSVPIMLREAEKKRFVDDGGIIEKGK